MTRGVVLGIDSSTQSTKVIALDIETGEVRGEGRAPHTGASIQDPRDWWTALAVASRQAVAGDHVLSIAVDGQQHGFVTLDAAGEPLLPAPLWNNTDSAPDAARLNELADFAAAVGSRLVPSFTITKLAHLARTNPAALGEIAAIGLPHDWLNFQLTGELVTDRGDASGSGWWSPLTESDRRDLLALAAGAEAAQRLRLPVVHGADQPAGVVTSSAAAALGVPAGIPVGPGTGDNMAAALGIGAAPGELVISLGTSGTVFAVTERPTADATGEVCGYADATGRFLPLACLLNCTRVVDTVAGMLGIGRVEALDRAAAAPFGASGLRMTPYLAGERTPNLPTATGAITGLTMTNATADNLLRAALEGVAAGLAYCVAAFARLGLTGDQITLVGGGSAHRAWRQVIADATGLPVVVRAGGEHAARGTAVQAAAIVREVPIAGLSQEWRPAPLATVEPTAAHTERFRQRDVEVVG